MPTKATSCKPAKVIPCGRKIKGETDDSSKDQSARCVRDTCIFCDETFPDPPEESNPAIPYDECKRVMHVMCIPSVNKALFRHVFDRDDADDDEEVDFSCPRCFFLDDDDSDISVSF